MPEFIKSLSLFLIAAVCELSGAYFVWLWQREGKSPLLALLGLAALFIYSLVQTNQAFGFGRTFAAYGGIFIASAMLWGWLIEKRAPDSWDLLGAGVCLLGAAIILLAPRT
ncbi:MAG: YnfA family protein [Anaerolineae bacterium]